MSRNGTLLNSRLLRHESGILEPGDTFEVAGQRFRFYASSTDKQESAVLGNVLKKGIHAEPAARELQRVQVKDGFLITGVRLGGGACSVVHLALNLKTLRQVACKKIQVEKLNERGIRILRKEIEFLRQLDHPSINHFAHVCEDTTRQTLYIFLELLPGGDLFSYLTHKTVLSAAETKWIAYQLMHALNYLHTERRIAHCDVKLENLVLATAAPFPSIALADFGQASYVDQYFTRMRGTFTYMAPEALDVKQRSKGYDGSAADCWSAGIVTATLILGFHPFEPLDFTRSPPTEDEVLRAFGEKQDVLGSVRDVALCLSVLRDAFVVPETAQLGSDATDARAFLETLLDKQPASRATAQSALHHTWLKVSEPILAAMYEALCKVT
ncbi:hypothetical protein ACM66B_003136 [Microbotryomycetes sp. NB124-2]